MNLIFGIGLAVLPVCNARRHHFIVGTALKLLGSGGSHGDKAIDALVKIAEEPRAATAVDDTLGQAALLNNALAHRALLDNALGCVEIAHAIGASANTQLAADTQLGVDLHRTVVHLLGGAGGANLHALGGFLQCWQETGR